jgi:hypothetical protein
MSKLTSKNLSDGAVELAKIAALAIGPTDDPLTEQVTKLASLGPTGKVPLNQLPDSVAGSTIGLPTDLSYEGGLIAISATDKIADVADNMNLILAKLAPSKPANLSAKTLSLAVSTYSAKEAGTNATRSVVTDALRPSTSAFLTTDRFYDGDAGVLSAEINASEVGIRTLTTASDVGTYSQLNINDDADYWAGSPGKEGFWKCLSARIVPTADLPYGENRYQLKHTMTGNTPVYTFYVDNPGTPGVSAPSVSLPSSTRFVSGVPSLDPSSNITVGFTVTGAVKKYFSTSKVASISGSNVSTTNIAPDAGGYAEDAVITLTGKTVSVNASTYAENASIALNGYNSKNVAGSASNQSTGARIDTVSNETLRRTSGSGLYPSTGYGSAYSYSADLKTTNTEELQMLNGIYRWPTGNYSANLPTNGPDYSSGMGSLDRWVTFNGSTITNKSSVLIQFTGATGFSANANMETSGIKIYLKVDGVTGWLDANKYFSLVGSPSADGDAAMTVSGSDADTKNVSFGSTPRTGQVYVRIGLPAGSGMSFSGVTIS